MNLNNYLNCIQGKESEYSLLLGDVNQIHAYVFETSKLPEVRGASQLLRTLIRTEYKKAFDKYFTDASFIDKINGKTNLGYPIYNNAGSCMAIVPKDKVEEFINDITAEFHRETGAVTITFVHSPLSSQTNEEGRPTPRGEISKWILESNKDEPKGYMKLLRFLQYRLQMEKKKKLYFPFLESNPIVRRCDHCGKRPAVHQTRIGDETNFLCNVCNKKRSEGGKFDILVNLAKKESFYGSYIGRIPIDLDTLAGDSGYIGILYADGNEMGNILYGAESFEEFKSKSRKIEDSIRESLSPQLRKFKHHKTLPFEILNMAGDDIIMILRAKYILQLSLYLLLDFQERCSNKLNEDVTMSLGTTIFKARYPIRYAFEITRSLLKSAKQFSKLNGYNPQSTISYLYMKTPIATFSSTEIRDSYYQVSDEVYLTMRPYTCEEFELLLKAANEIKEKQILTSSQMSAISRSFEEKSLYSTMNFTKYQIARMKDSKRKSLFGIIEKLKNKLNLKDLDSTDELPLWGKRTINGKEVCATPLLDIFEILEITGGDLFE